VLTPGWISLWEDLFKGELRVNNGQKTKSTRTPTRPGFSIDGDGGKPVGVPGKVDWSTNESESTSYFRHCATPARHAVPKLTVCHGIQILLGLVELFEEQTRGIMEKVVRSETLSVLLAAADQMTQIVCHESHRDGLLIQ
jgi:hypothetical protein